MIAVTEKAAEKIRESLGRRGRGLGIRIGVRTTGCSGLGYVLEYVDAEPEEHNTRYHSNGVSIWIDAKSAPYLQGLTMDWQRKGLNEGFEFLNPNEVDRCGCGESFRV